MDLVKEIIQKLLENEEIKIPNSKFSIAELGEMKCYQALRNIKNIIEDDNFSDVECFDKIEEIVCVLEDIGIGGGARHDFG